MKQEVKAFIEKHTTLQCQRNVEAAVELQILYKAALNKSVDCLTCDSKINAAYQELVQYSLNNKIHSMSENFKLKAGQQIFLHATHEVIHENNLESDEQALKLLQQNPGLIAAFEEYPEDWKKQVEALPAEASHDEGGTEDESKSESSEETEASHDEGGKPHKGKGKKK